MLDKYLDGLLWHIFSAEDHSREKPVQVNQLSSKTHLSSFLCQHKLNLLNPKEDHIDSVVMYAVFMAAKWHKEYGLELRAENPSTKILQSRIDTWLYQQKAAQKVISVQRYLNIS